jgi:hypothetical protein
VVVEQEDLFQTSNQAEHRAYLTQLRLPGEVEEETVLEMQVNLLLLTTGFPVALVAVVDLPTQELQVLEAREILHRKLQVRVTLGQQIALP